jgi:hypothetical protein
MVLDGGVQAGGVQHADHCGRRMHEDPEVLAPDSTQNVLGREGGP